VRASEVPESIAMDKSRANMAAIDEINNAMATPILVRQVAYFNNIVEQGHPAIKDVTDPCWASSRLEPHAMCRQASS
jgi:putative transposase